LRRRLCARGTGNDVVVEMRRNPVLSETDAFRLTVTTVGVVVAACVVGWLVTPVVGAALFAVAALVGLGAYLSGPEPGRRLPLRRAAHEHHRLAGSPGTRHVLVVANEPLAGEQLHRHVRDTYGERVELDVLAPVLSSRTHLAYTDIDAETRRARERLARSLAWAQAHGFLARGRLGDASPTTAIEDALRDFGADEVIVATGSGSERWQEQAELKRLREELDVPVVRVAVGDGRLDACAPARTRSA
jgi:hypothetical protein